MVSFVSLYSILQGVLVEAVFRFLLFYNAAVIVSEGFLTSADELCSSLKDILER